MDHWSFFCICNCVGHCHWSSIHFMAIVCLERHAISTIYPTTWMTMKGDCRQHSTSHVKKMKTGLKVLALLIIVFDCFITFLCLSFRFSFFIFLCFSLYTNSIVICIFYFTTLCSALKSTKEDQSGCMQTIRYLN